MSDDRFISININKIYPDLALPADLYLFINGHFIKYKLAGDEVPKAKYELFVLQKVQYVFVKAEDEDAHKGWYEKQLGDKKGAILADIGEENEDIVDSSLDVKEKLYDLMNDEVTDETAAEMMDKAKDLINKVNSRNMADRFVGKIQMYDQGIYDHSNNVANLSVYLAMNIGYAQQRLLENIYLGALMHDFGKVRINSKHLEDPNSEEYKTAMRKHPQLGKTSLLLDSGFPDEVLRIISEHHERHDGRGFPKGLKGGRIFDLTKIVSIANNFDNHVRTGTGPIPQRQQMALAKLAQDKGHLFDPKILHKCIKALGLLFKK